MGDVDQDRMDNGRSWVCVASATRLVAPDRGGVVGQAERQGELGLMFNQSDFHVISDIIIALGVYTLVIACGLSLFASLKLWAAKINLKLEVERRRAWHAAQEARKAFTEDETLP